MCLLLESIKLKDGILQNIEQHNLRLNCSRKDLFNSKDIVDLSQVISIPSNCSQGIYKCRVLYSKQINKIEFIPYIPKKINTLGIVKDDTIDYRYKYADRTQIDNLLKQSLADDIIIVKNGYITDASYANLIFFDGAKWVTPAHPLLKGTKRQLLLENGHITEQEIKVIDLKHFHKVKLINAMLDFDNDDYIAMDNIIQRIE